MTQIPDDQMALANRPLPSMAPTAVEDWLVVNGDYAAQLAEKAAILEDHETKVLRIETGAEAAVAELGYVLTDALAERSDFDVTETAIRCPDGRTVGRDVSSGLHLAASTVQEDICILEKRGDEHVLTAALLAFPASWSLTEKIGRPMTRIHQPVHPYDAGIAMRVQKMFDALPAGRILRRANALGYDDPALFQPRSENARREKPKGPPKWMRSERQTIRKLPGTGAIVFTILTTIAPQATTRTFKTVSEP